MKIFGIKPFQQTKIQISQKIAEPELSILNECSGVIDNFLKHKKDLGEISIKDGDIFGNPDYISVVHTKPKELSRISVKKNGDSPFLRKVYEAVEYITKNE